MDTYTNDSGKPIDVAYTDERGELAVLHVGKGAEVTVVDDNTAAAVAIVESLKE